MDIEWPADLIPYRAAFYLQHHVGGAESPFSRTTKTYGLSAPRWVARFTFRGGDDLPYPGRPAGFARRLDAMIALSRGTARFKLWDFRRERPIRPLPIVSTSGLTLAATAAGANAVVVRGLSPFARAFDYGDYIGGDDRPHIVTGPAVADADGVAEVSFEPAWSSNTADGAPAITARVPGWFKLSRDSADDAGANETEVGQLSEYVLTFVEDLPVA
ncbi:hypothetical protein ACQEPB_00505 [Novosphingobium fluoreni]|uniref:hypothetical protein n=1 Tax=Novosphingobium fluoreni TaxID=1391222 RepID=UPI003DA0A6EC